MSKRAKRFLDSVALQPKDWLRGAESYVDKLSDEDAQWLLRKPYRAEETGTFFYEMYQVLNLLEALRLGEGARVLEVGSGSGWVTELLVKLGYDVDCVEPSEKMIRISEERVRLIPGFYRPTQPRWFCETLEDFEGESESYDAVLFHESLHHIIDENAGLRNAYRVLKLGGKLAVDEHAWIDGDRMLEEKLVSEMAAYGTLENPFSISYLNELLADIGFRDITRFHMINGFIDEELGDTTVKVASQNPSEVTNNLIAVKPFGKHYTTKDDGCPVDVRVMVENVAFEPHASRLTISVTVSNQGETYLLQGGAGRPGEVYFSLYAGTREESNFTEAPYRNALPMTLAPRATRTVQLEYSLPVGMENREWHLDLLAEHRFWFSDKGVNATRIPDLV